jgi:hypothetical protein
MTKRKSKAKSKASRKSSQDRKGQGRKRRGRKSRARGVSTLEAPRETTRELTPDPGAALTPAPALPSSGGGVTRDKKTRGGKSTLSTHELLAEVPPPPRAKPAAASPQSSRSQAGRPQPTRQQPGRSMYPVPEAPLSQAQIYEALAALLVPYARKMESEMHPKIGFCLKAKSTRTGRETHFGAVQALPDGVAFHLFPLYGHPDLLENVSPELFNRLRGKTCFHFDGLHAGLVAELAELTHAGFERFLSDGVF